MTARAAARTVLAYGLASTVTAIAAFLASIPFTDPTAIAAITADAAILIGWPVLLFTDHTTNRRKDVRP